MGDTLSVGDGIEKGGRDLVRENPTENFLLPPARTIGPLKGGPARHAPGGHRRVHQVPEGLDADLGGGINIRRPSGGEGVGRNGISFLQKDNIWYIRPKHDSVIFIWDFEF